MTTQEYDKLKVTDKVYTLGNNNLKIIKATITRLVSGHKCVNLKHTNLSNGYMYYYWQIFNNKYECVCYYRTQLTEQAEKTNNNLKKFIENYGIVKPDYLK